MNEMKTVIVTGGNSGLGFECARHIAADSANWQVILACRSKEKAEAAKAILTEETGNPNLLTMELDVSSLASVRAFAERYKALGLPAPEGLVCNAGIMGGNTGRTPEGFDLVFATNHLGHFLLTLLLLPSMSPTGRIVMVSSDMHCPPGAPLVWPGAAALARPEQPLASDSRRYSYSKLCNLYFTYELSRRLSALGSKITVNAFNPGLMTDTNFAPDKSRFTPAFLEAVSDRIGDLDKSSRALAAIMTAPEFAAVSGKYYDRSTETIASSPLSHSGENALDLWNESCAAAQLTADI